MNTKHSGFTLLELTLTLSIAAVAIMAMTTFIKNNNESTHYLSKKMGDLIEKQLTSRIIRRDLLMSKYSLSLIDLKDDKERGFFDFTPNQICSSFEEGECQRLFILEKPETTEENIYSKSLYLITEDRDDSAREQFYSPAQAFIGNNFVGLNRDNYMANKVSTPWQSGKLIILYSPTFVINPDKTIYPKLLGFMGWLKDDSKEEETLIAETIKDENGVSLFNNYNPKEGAQNNIERERIDNEKEMLLENPTISGMSGQMLISSVQVIRYRLVTYREGNKIKARLLRGVLRFNPKTNETTIFENNVGTNIQRVIFERESISTPSISFDIVPETIRLKLGAR